MATRFTASVPPSRTTAAGMPPSPPGGSLSCASPGDSSPGSPTRSLPAFAWPWEQERQSAEPCVAVGILGGGRHWAVATGAAVWVAGHTCRKGRWRCCLGGRSHLPEGPLALLSGWRFNFSGAWALLPRLTGRQFTFSGAWALLPRVLGRQVKGVSPPPARRSATDGEAGPAAHPVGHHPRGHTPSEGVGHTCREAWFLSRQGGRGDGGPQESVLIRACLQRGRGGSTCWTQGGYPR